MKNKLTAVFGLAAIATSMISNGAYAQWTGGYEVSVNGKNVGVVEDAATVRHAVAMVNNKLMNEYGMDEKIEPDVKLKAIIVSDEKLSDNKDIYCAVASVSDKLTDAVRITVDGKKTICVKDRDEAQLVVKEVVKMLSSGIEDAQSGVIQLVGNSDDSVFEREIYSVEDAVNYFIENEYFSVKSEKTEIFTEDYIPEPIKILNSEMYEKDEKVVAEGRVGKQIRKVTNSYINSEAVQTNESVEIVDKGIPATIEVGTKKRPDTGTGVFIMPAKGRLTSPYGERWGRMHKGLDIAAPVGTPVCAADNGVVICSEYKNSFGNLVKIDHNNGYVTYYAHNSELLVKVGDTVSKGQMIAKMGSTGRSTGPHCHFEVLKDGVNINPASVVG